MESLAVLVTILLLSAVFSGPIAFALTYIHVQSKKGRLIKRSGITLFSIWGALTALQFAISNLSLFPRIMGVVGITIPIMAVKREFSPRSRNN